MTSWLQFALDWHNAGGCDIQDYLSYAPPENVVMETTDDTEEDIC